jgi:phytanoyl-CoA hydroxylase
MSAPTWRGEVTIDEAVGGAYDQELYRCSGVVAKLAGRLADLKGDVVADYRLDGYIAVEGAFNSRQVSEAIVGIDHLISGQIPGFRGIQWETAGGDRLRSMDLNERRDAVRKLIYFVEYEPRLRALAQDEQLLRTVAHLLGDEQPELFSDQALLKPPGIGREKPWHQDLAFYDLCPGSPIVGVWIALDRTVPGNGCMHLIPGSHHGGPMVHFNRRDFQICDDQVAAGRVYAVPLEPGGVLFFDGLLHHGTPANVGNMRRWAVQLHYAPRGALASCSEHRATYRQRRLDMFGSEGKDVTC